MMHLMHEGRNIIPSGQISREHFTTTNLHIPIKGPVQLTGDYNFNKRSFISKHGTKGGYISSDRNRRFE